MKARVEGTDNYAMLESPIVSFQIKKAKISVAADDISGKKGDEIKELTYHITETQIAGETLEVMLSTDATSESNYGSYPIIVRVDASNNYEVTKVNGTYHILDTDLDIQAEGVNTVYDGHSHGISVTVKDAEGVVANDVIVYYSETALTNTTNIASQSGVQLSSPTRRVVGTTRVYYYVTKDGTVIMDGSKNITITQKELLVKAKDKTIYKGEVAANDGVTYEGFVSGDGVSDLKGQVSFSYNYAKGQPAGSYQITPSGLMATNYRISYVNGVLTVLPVQEEIAITGISKQDTVYDGKKHTGFIGTPGVEGGVVSEFTYIYKASDGSTFTEAPKDAGNYTLTISIPDTNRLYKGKVELTFT